MAPHGREEDVLHQGGFPRSADSSDHRHHVEWELHVDVLQVVLVGAFQDDGVVPAAASGRHGNGLFAFQILAGKALRTVYDIFVVALAHKLSAELASQGPDIDDVVGVADDFLIMLHHDHRIADVAETLQHFDQPVSVARMQPDAGLVEDVGGTHEAAAQ